MLVIFDCDGVLVNSEVIANDIFVQELSQLGFHISYEESLEKFTGLSDKKVYELIESVYQKRFTQTEIDQIQNQIMKELSSRVQAIQGVQSLLRKLQTYHIPYCIASSGALERINTVLQTSKLAPFFKEEMIFSSSMVSRGKPEPDLFLLAAEKMKKTALDCWVIEDSRAGIQAAKAANMRHIAFFGAEHTQFPWYFERIMQENPEYICNDMHEVESILEKNFKLRA